MAVRHPSSVMAHGTPRLWNCIVNQYVYFTKAASKAADKSENSPWE